MKKIFVIPLLLLVMGIGHGSLVSNAVAEDSVEEIDTSVTMSGLICNVLGFLVGKVGKALAAFACMGVSLAFLAGKVSWTLVLTFSLAMACIFGAPTIIKVFTGSSEAACDNSGGSGES
jgi:type IV secretory pathway VirB2 component (pilin)